MRVVLRAPVVQFLGEQDGSDNAMNEGNLMPLNPKPPKVVALRGQKKV